MFGAFRLMPVGLASGIWGRLGRLVGPRLSRSRDARAALGLTFPDMTERDKGRIVASMWDNLFRTAVEFVHLPKILATDGNLFVEIVGEEKFRAVRDAGTPVLLISGHFANWEIGALPMLRRGGRTGIVYRRSNNPIVDHLIAARRGIQDYDLLPKGREGASGILRIIREGGQIAMLVDQKFNEGISVPFLGRDAMTSTAPAELAYKYGVALIPWRPERIGGCRFRLTIHDPLVCDPTAERAGEVERLTREINDLLSGWIQDRPEQWMWAHRRWPK